ncbi:hypothetical protein IWW52_003666, partial [Coemansia sp. RSA 2704]
MRFSCCGLLSGIFRIGFWILVIVVSLVPLCAFISIVTIAFKPPSISSAEQSDGGGLCFPKWQEPFVYGAKVYASLHKNALNTTDFFSSAQLLWHVESADLHDRYPKLATTATVDIPHELSSSVGNLTLYAHIFVQTADALLPHPDVSEGSLVYSSARLAYWRPVNATAWDLEPALNMPLDNVGYELVAQTGVPWAINLEDHVYSIRKLPSFANKISGTIMPGGKSFATYKPLLQLNTFTEAPSGTVQLALRNPDEAQVSASASNTRVQLKFQGIRHGWLALKNMIDTVFPLDGPHFKLLKPESSTIVDIVGNKHQNTVRLNADYYIANRAMATLLYACFLVLLSFPAFAVNFITSLSFWTGPKGKWAGVPRTIILLEIAGSAVVIAFNWFEPDKLWGNRVLALCVGYTVVVLADLPGNPLRWPRHIYNSLRMYKDAQPLATLEMDGSEDTREQRVVAARRSVDCAFIAWIRSTYLFALVAMMLHALAFDDSRWWSVGHLERLANSHIMLIAWIQFVPQIMLNHIARSGSLVPPAIGISYVCSRTLLAAAMYVFGAAGQ